MEASEVVEIFSDYLSCTKAHYFLFMSFAMSLCEAAISCLSNMAWDIYAAFISQVSNSLKLICIDNYCFVAR